MASACQTSQGWGAWWSWAWWGSWSSSVVTVGFMVFDHVDWEVTVKYWHTYMYGHLWQLLYAVQAVPCVRTLRNKMVCQPYKQCSGCSCGSWLSGFLVNGDLSGLREGWWRGKEWGEGFMRSHKHNGPVSKEQRASGTFCFSTWAGFRTRPRTRTRTRTRDSFIGPVWAQKTICLFVFFTLVKET